VLDVGCGRGDVLAAMQPAEWLGIDLSESMVKLAAAELPHLSFARRQLKISRATDRLTRLCSSTPPNISLILGLCARIRKSDELTAF
jgi:trans-aconitate methyltransferase